MTGWQLTATTIYCEDISDEVTIVVRKDWTVSCTGSRNRSQSGVGGRQKPGVSVSCDPAGCRHVQAYRVKLHDEESKLADGR